LNECNKYSSGNFVIKADISNEESVKNMFSDVKKKYKTIHVLINNVGIFDEKDSPNNLFVFNKIFQNNLISHVMVIKYARQLMGKGKIINISSIHGRLGHGRPSAIAYSALKAALESYTKNLAKELAPDILVNAIAPGRVVTHMWKYPTISEQRRLGRTHLIKRMIQPEEIADGILFLVHNDAVCGEVLTIDGGMSLVTLG
jgi:3-oxoacyl-[acyl-carrier protein] reductase